jgi:starch synthase (maltosyl-transferring)
VSEDPSPPVTRPAATFASDGRRRVVIDAIRPQVDGGRYPVKRILGDTVSVSADLLVDGHDHLAGVLRFRRQGAAEWREVALMPVGPPPARFSAGVVAPASSSVSQTAATPTQPAIARAHSLPANDGWQASFVVDAIGTWEYTVEAWVDVWSTWTWGLNRKLGVGQNVDLELQVGCRLVRAAAARASGGDRAALDELASRLADSNAATESRSPRQGQDDSSAAGARAALSPQADALMRAHPDRSAATTHHAPLGITVDPPYAGFSSWYEMFPRSTTSDGAGGHGTFRTAEQRLPYIADMGFDIVYLPPIHPIGFTYRKGPDNSLTAGPGDPGSPWAIGSSEGGHLAVHPELGTLDDFRHFVAAARQQGLEVALDIALQTSPDHPYVKQHPEWFVHRPDGSIQYAENPPKKYQDIYPFDFAGPAWQSLWQEARGIFLYWIEQGVRVFRVDNPHTKPIPFWHWCLTSIKDSHPEVIFLAEAFTRPKLMYALAKVGFSQSYSYFTWRTSKVELTTYLRSIVDSDLQEFFRPNFWPNTPDILPEHLQFGTRATFVARAVLAATLSPNWGVYGPAFELQEKRARPGSEEYADNEKYELRSWELDRPDSLQPILRRLNQIRRDNPSLKRLAGTTFHETDNPSLICYSRVDDAAASPILVVVNLDSHNRHSGWISLDLEALGLAADARFQVHDLIGDGRYLWQGGRAFVELDPQVMPAHIFRVRRHMHSEQTFEYYL